MNVFAIGDLHLSHTSNKPMHVFGVHWENHMDKIKAKWESNVTSEYIVLIPGDISWAMRLKEAGPDLEWLDELPGHKICIRGNHDYWWDRPSPLNRKYQHTYFLQNTTYLVGEVAICGTRGWSIGEQVEKIEETEKMIARECGRLKLSLDAALKEKAKEIWVMIHYPPYVEDATTSPFIELMKQYPVTKVIYGHLHDASSWEKAKIGEYEGIMYQLVSADYLDFKPLLIARLEEEC